MSDALGVDWFLTLEHSDAPHPTPRHISLADLTGPCDNLALDQLKRQRSKSGEKKREKEEKVGVLVPFGVVFGRGKEEGSISRLVSPVISKFHCSMHITTNGHVYLTDLGSSHGTTIRIRTTDVKPHLTSSSASRHPKSQEAGNAVVLRPHSPVQLLDGDTIVFGKKVVSTEATHQPLELCVKFRYPELGVAEGGRKSVGTIDVKWAERHFVRSESEGNVARLNRNIDKYQPKRPRVVDEEDVEPKEEETSDINEERSEVASSVGDGESQEEDPSEEEDASEGEDESDHEDGADEEETPSEYGAHYEDEDDEEGEGLAEQSEEDDKPDLTSEPCTPIKPVWSATPIIQPEPTSIRSMGSGTGKYGVPESVLYQSDDNDEPVPRYPPPSSSPAPSEPLSTTRKEQTNSIDMSLANAIMPSSPLSPPPVPDELSEEEIWQIKREATEHVANEAREAAKKIREETALILADVEPESAIEDEDDVGSGKEGEITQPAREATPRRYGRDAQAKSSHCTVHKGNTRPRDSSVNEDGITSPLPEHTSSPALLAGPLVPSSPSPGSLAYPPCWRVYNSAGNPISSVPDLPPKPKEPRRPYSDRAFNYFHQRTYEELDEQDMFDLEILWEEEEQEEAALAAIEAAKKAEYERGVKDGEQHQKEMQKQNKQDQVDLNIDANRSRRKSLTPADEARSPSPDHAAMGNEEEVEGPIQVRGMSDDSVHPDECKDDKENDEEDMDIIHDGDEHSDSDDEAISDADEASNHEAQEDGYSYRASDDEAEEGEDREEGDVDWERFFADDNDDDDAPPLVLKTGSEMEKKGKQVERSLPILEGVDVEENAQLWDAMAARYEERIKRYQLTGQASQMISSSSQTMISTPGAVSAPVDQASQTDSGAQATNDELHVRIEARQSLGRQDSDSSSSSSSDTSSSGESDPTEEHDKDDAQTVFDIVDTGIRTPQVDMDAEMEMISKGWGIGQGPIRPLPGLSGGIRIRPFAIPTTGAKTKQDKKREKRERQKRKMKISDISHFRAGAHIRFEEKFDEVLKRVDEHISLADREARWSDLSASHESHPPRHSFSSGSEGSSAGPVTPKYSLRPLKRSAHVAFDEPTILDPTLSPERSGFRFSNSPSRKRAGTDHPSSPPSKRARLASTLGTVGSVLGLVVLGAALGSVGTIAGLMQLAD